MPEQYQEFKSAIDSILDVSSVIKRKKKNESEKKLDLFVKMINSLEEIEARSVISQFDIDIDLTKYDEKFMDVIDTLLYMLYGQNCYNIISFYRYERLNPADGSINPILIEETGESVYLQNPYDLYNLMRRINDKID